MILASVVGAMEMGNIVPRARIETTYLTFQASLLTITPHRLTDATTLPTPTSLQGSLPERLVQPTTLVLLEW